MKKLKEEEACIEKVLKHLQGYEDENKKKVPPQDVRKGNWSPKEVCFQVYFNHDTFHDDKRP
jgi:hypothetical protein